MGLIKLCDCGISRAMKDSSQVKMDIETGSLVLDSWEREVPPRVFHRAISQLQDGTAV